MKPARLLSLIAATSLAGVTQDLPVFKVTTRLVQVDVTVRDAQGPLTDLTEDEFQLFDQGKPQKIAVFQRNGEPVSRSRETAEATPQSGVFSNHQERATAATTVILLDGNMTEAMEQLWARRELREFLAKVQPGERVAIYLLSEGLRVVQPATGSAASLLHALDVQQWGAGYLPNKLKPDAAFTKSRALINAQLAALVQGAKSTFISTHADPLGLRIQQECFGLVGLARHLALVPGRKNLIWITSGFPLVAWGTEPKVYTVEVSQVNHAFNDAEVAVYAVDARGLLPPAGAAMTMKSHAAPPDLSSGLRSPAAQAVGESGQDTMEFVAKYTGGKAYTNGNDLKSAIEKFNQDSAVVYTLGFYPDPAALDSKRHVLKVTVGRRGVDLRYRLDYAATPEAPETRIPEKAEITEAIWSPVDATGIRITAQVEKVNQPETGLLQVTLSIVNGDVTLQRDDQGWAGALALLYEERSADGRDMGRISETLNLRYDEEHYRQLGAEDISYQKLVHPAAEATQIRVVVYDRGSGRVGSVMVEW